MRKNVMYKNIIYTLVTVGCMFLFVMLFCSKASAGVEISDQESHVTYKQVMKEIPCLRFLLNMLPGFPACPVHSIWIRSYI